MKFLSFCISDIDDIYLEEAETADIAAERANRKRIKKYSALAAVASVGVAIGFALLRAKRVKRAKAAA